MSIALAVAALAIAAPPAGATAVRVPLGHFAGYVWDDGPVGAVGAVGATFLVPRIGRGSPRGSLAGTWIGAQAPGVDAPFIQIGINELHLGLARHAPGVPSNLYYAFWSDTRLASTRGSSSPWRRAM